MLASAQINTYMYLIDMESYSTHLPPVEGTAHFTAVQCPLQVEHALNVILYA